MLEFLPHLHGQGSFPSCSWHVPGQQKSGPLFSAYLCSRSKTEFDAVFHFATSRDCILQPLNIPQAISSSLRNYRHSDNIIAQTDSRHSNCTSPTSSMADPTNNAQEGHAELASGGENPPQSIISDTSTAVAASGEGPPESISDDIVARMGSEHIANGTDSQSHQRRRTSPGRPRGIPRRPGTPPPLGFFLYDDEEEPLPPQEQPPPVPALPTDLFRPPPPVSRSRPTHLPFQPPPPQEQRPPAPAPWSNLFRPPPLDGPAWPALGVPTVPVRPPLRRAPAALQIPISVTEQYRLEILKATWGGREVTDAIRGLVKTVESGGSCKQMVEISPKDFHPGVSTEPLLTCRALSVLYRYGGHRLGLLNGAEDTPMEKWIITPQCERLQFWQEEISDPEPFYEIQKEFEPWQSGVLSPDNPRTFDQSVQMLAVVFGVKHVVDYRVHTFLRQFLEARKPEFTPSAKFFRVRDDTRPSGLRTWTVFYRFRSKDLQVRCLTGFEGPRYTLSTEDLALAGGVAWLSGSGMFTTPADAGSV